MTNIRSLKKKIIDDYEDHCECYSTIENVDTLKEFLPYKPYCSDNMKKNGLMIRPRATALGKKYIQLNPPHMIKFLTFDLDYSTWAYVAEDFNLPQPMWCVGNCRNGHAHLIYVLRNPVFTTSMAHSEPLRYLKVIRDAYCRKLEADPMYSGLISKNPWSDKWVVYQTSDMVYDLGYLADYVYNYLYDVKPMKEAREEVAGLGRNCYIFEHARVWAYRAIRDFWGEGWGKGFSNWNDAVIFQCQHENAKFSEPLFDREIKQIAKSIACWTWKHLKPESFSESQRKLVNRRWSRESQKTQGMEMLQDGCSIDEVMCELGVCKRTVYNWMKEASHNEVKLTLTELQTRPWEALGISRRWYYELKKKRKV